MSDQKAFDILQQHIEEENLEYADNFRVACTSDVDAMDAFNEASANGCCGSYETTVIIDNQTWVIGCNYGH